MKHRVAQISTTFWRSFVNFGAASALLAACAPNDTSPPRRGAAPSSERPWEDSASTGPEATILRTWLAYLRSKPAGLATGAGIPSPLWSSEEQAKWPMYDLAGFYVPDGARPEVIAIQPAEGDEYQVVTRFTLPDSTASSAHRRTALTLTIYASRAGDRWLLANALPRLTRSWHSETVGQITFFLEPGRSFDRARAQRAVAFIDSLAMAFEVPRLRSVDYYITGTVDGALRVLGVEYPTAFGPGGGFAKPVNHQVFAAVPRWGEEYRHELVHLVVLPLLRGANTTVLASEGLATWLGGTAGMDRQEAVRSLWQYLTAHPHVTLDSVLTGSLPQTQTYAAGAVLCALSFRHGGTPAVKRLLASGPRQLRTTLEELLDLPWEGVLQAWQEEMDRLRVQTRLPPNPALDPRA
jgi:hypothetical protein